MHKYKQLTSTRLPLSEKRRETNPPTSLMLNLTNKLSQMWHHCNCLNLKSSITKPFESTTYFETIIEGAYLNQLEPS